MHIETERLLLRRFTPADFETMYALWTDGESMRYVQPEGWPHNVEDSRALFARSMRFFDEHGFGQFAVVPKQERRVIGYCGLKFLNEAREVELLYGVFKEFWNRGLVTEAARAVLRYGFEAAGLGRIVAVALPDNVGSWRVMEKLGMRREGLTEHKGYRVVRYSLARDEFDPGEHLYVYQRDEGGGAGDE